MSRPFREITVSPGRILHATPVFDTYWRFACARQEIFHRRVAGERPPWTDDPILGSHRFTNVYRASDRVSQFLIRNVLYTGDQNPEEVFFRGLLFKIFNRIDTWECLQRHVGVIAWRDFQFERYAEALDSLLGRQGVYSGAYIMPSPPFGDPRKHRNHLRLLERMMHDGLPSKIASAASLRAAYEAILGYPSMGPFLAFQFAIDLNYSGLCNFSEMEFVVAGPGARDGMRKCFTESAGFSDSEIIRIVTERAEDEFARLDLPFKNLWGRRLQLIDCQNVFCEVDKYARVMHPEYSGVSGRTRIKQRFAPTARALPQWYPPKWGIVAQCAVPSTSDIHTPRQLQLVPPVETRKVSAPNL